MHSFYGPGALPLSLSKSFSKQDPEAGDIAPIFTRGELKLQTSHDVPRVTRLQADLSESTAHALPMTRG